MTATPAQRWLIAKAILGGLIIAVGGGLVWSVLVAVNLSASLAIPWAVPVMAVLLVASWRIIKGLALASPNAPAPVPYLPQSRAKAGAYAWGCGIGLVALTFLLLVHWQLDLPLGAPPPGTDQFPAQALLYFAMASFVAAASEEAGFRGWMQSGLTSTLGKLPAFVIIACLFALLHAGNPAFLYLLPLYFGLSLAYSQLVARAGSIWPAMAGHFLADFLSYCLLLFGGFGAGS